MKKLTLLIALLLAGCAASQEKLDSVAAVEATRLVESSKPLSAFAAYELKGMILSPEVAAKSDKVEQAAVLEQKIQEKLQPLFAEWSSSNEPGRSGTLIVQPELVKLRIVSGGARFFAGAFSGNSFIDLDLRLTDGATDSEIAKPRISKHAGAMGGAWSLGKTDTNLHDYIAHITHRYMVENY
jgi:hypothetical protein